MTSQPKAIPEGPAGHPRNLAEKLGPASRRFPDPSLLMYVPFISSPGLHGHGQARTQADICCWGQQHEHLGRGCIVTPRF